MLIVKESVPFIIIWLAGGFLCAAMAVVAWKRRALPSAGSFAGLMAAVAIYAIASSFEIAGGTLERMRFWIDVEYVGIAFIPAFFILIAVWSTGQERCLSRRATMILFVMSSVILLVKLTDRAHHLFYRELGVHTAGPFPVARIAPGPFYWILIGYLHLSLLMGTILFLRMWLRAAPSGRRQAALLFFGTLAPWAANFIYLIGRSPWGLDLSPIGFVVTGPLFMWGCLRFRLLDLTPAARDTVFESMRDAVLVLDPMNRVVDFNRAAREFLPGLSRSGIGRPAAELLQDHPELARQLAEGETPEVKLQVPDGSGRRAFQSRLSLIYDRRKRLLGRTLVLSDVTAQERLFKALEAQATTDGLTGVLNRRHFLELVRREIARAKRYRRPFSVMIMDLDHFKQVNDVHGHEAGDQALRAVALICRARLRESDLFARFGGEEFVFLLPETPPDEALALAERLCTRIASAPLLIRGAEIGLTVSFGVAGVQDPETVDWDALLKQADQALDEAKSMGRNRAVRL